jgi:anaerobic selenocysteine-containing dehydrogenase
LVGRTKKTFFRLGFGFSRQRNGAANMHAALCIPAVTGAWAHEGGGAFHSNSGLYKLHKAMIEGLDVRDSTVRRLDQSRVGAILTSEPDALKGGPPVRAMLIQNTNPLAVAPRQDKVRRGFSRDDLFVCVHEQFMTDTARYADVVLPATMFLEHDDIYTGGGHQHLQFASKVVEPPDGCRSNHEVLVGLAGRLGAVHPAFSMSPREIIDWTLRKSGYGDLKTLESQHWLDLQPPFEQSHFLDGFGFPDGKFRFKADWSDVPLANDGLKGDWRRLPSLPDHWPVNEGTDEEHPFKLATSPAHNFLNSTFTQTPGSLTRERRPEVLIHPDDATAIGMRDGEIVELGNDRGRTRLHLRVTTSASKGVLVSEGIWPPSAFLDGWGINVLVGDDSVAPYGGVAFHDTSVWARRG